MDKAGTVSSNQKSQPKQASSPRKKAPPQKAKNGGKNQGAHSAAAPPKTESSKGAAAPKKTNSLENSSFSRSAKEGPQKAAATGLVMAPAISSSIASSTGAMGSSLGSGLSGMAEGAQKGLNDLTSYFGGSSKSPQVNLDAQSSGEQNKSTPVDNANVVDNSQSLNGQTTPVESEERIKAKIKARETAPYYHRSPIYHPEGMFLNSKIENKTISGWLNNAHGKSGLNFENLVLTLEAGPFKGSMDNLENIEVTPMETNASGGRIFDKGKSKSSYFFNWKRDKDGSRTHADVTGSISLKDKYRSDYNISLDYLKGIGTVSVTNNEGPLSSLTKHPERYAELNDIVEGHWAEIQTKNRYEADFSTPRSVVLRKFVPGQSPGRGMTDTIKLTMEHLDPDGFPIGKPVAIHREFSTTSGHINKMDVENGVTKFTSIRQFDAAEGPVKVPRHAGAGLALPQTGDWNNIVAMGQWDPDSALGKLSPEMVARIQAGPPLSTDKIFETGATLKINRGEGTIQVSHSKDGEEIQWQYDSKNQPLAVNVKTPPKLGPNGVTSHSELNFVGGENPTGTFKRSYSISNFDPSAPLPDEMKPPPEAPTSQLEENGKLSYSYFKPIKNSIARIQYHAEISPENTLSVTWEELIKQHSTTPALVEQRLPSIASNEIVAVPDSKLDAENHPSTVSRANDLVKKVVVGNIHRGLNLFRPHKQDGASSNEKREPTDE